LPICRRAENKGQNFNLFDSSFGIFTCPLLLLNKGLGVVDTRMPEHHEGYVRSLLNWPHFMIVIPQTIRWITEVLKSFIPVILLMLYINQIRNFQLTWKLTLDYLLLPALG